MEGLRHKWMAPFTEHFRYKFHTGMIAWVLHRITGLGILAFLCIHIWSMSHLGAGQNAFEKAMAIYSTPLFQVGEILLLTTILFHAMNGLRIIWIDFFNGAKRHKMLFYCCMALGLVLFVIAISIKLSLFTLVGCAKI